MLYTDQPEAEDHREPPSAAGHHRRPHRQRQVGAGAARRRARRRLRDQRRRAAGLRLLAGPDRAAARHDESHARRMLYGHVGCQTRYSVGAWLRDLPQVLERPAVRGLRPMIVGGTGLYLTALTEGLADDSAESRRRCARGHPRRLQPDDSTRLRDDLARDGIRRRWRRSTTEPDAGPARLGGPDRNRPRPGVLAARNRGRRSCRRRAAYLLWLIRIISLLNSRIEERFQKMLEDGALEECRRCCARASIRRFRRRGRSARPSFWPTFAASNRGSRPIAPCRPRDPTVRQAPAHLVPQPDARLAAGSIRGIRTCSNDCRRPERSEPLERCFGRGRSSARRRHSRQSVCTSPVTSLRSKSHARSRPWSKPSCSVSSRTGSASSLCHRRQQVGDPCTGSVPRSPRPAEFARRPGRAPRPRRRAAVDLVPDLDHAGLRL